MNPLKKQEIIKLTSKKLNIPEEDVEKMVNLYYKEIKNTIKYVKHVNVSLIGLGTFSIMSRKLERSLTKKKRFVDMVENRMDDISMISYKELQKRKAEVSNMEEVFSSYTEQQEKRKIMKESRVNNNH